MYSHFRPVFQADLEVAQHRGRRADHHRRLHVTVLRHVDAAQGRAEGCHAHRQEGGRPGHRARSVAHQRRRRRDLHGQQSQRRQEAATRDCGYSRLVGISLYL